MRNPVRLFAFSTAAMAMATPAMLAAQAPGVAALLEQGRYWQSRGRTDLANQAYRRVLTIDPGNAAARQALAGPPRRTPAPAPAPKPTPAPAPTAPRQAPTPVAASTTNEAPVRPRTERPAPAADRGGEARAAGFQALDAGDLATAARRFQTALSRNANDADALGGLGLVRLRTQQFAEARDLLQRASRGGNASKWAEALNSARFFAGIAEGEAAADAGRLDEAQRIAEGLVHSDFADKSPAYDLLGGIYERQGRYADAAQLYAQAAGRSGGKAEGSVQARAIRAQALDAASTGNVVLAEQLFQRGMMADPKDPWIRYEFARFLEKRGRRADADAIAGGLRTSSDAESLYAAALLLSQTDRASDAEALLDRIPQASRTAEMRGLAINIKADAAIARARTMAGQGQGSQAIAALRQLAETPGLTIANKGALADALFDLGDIAGASLIAQQALSEGSDDPRAYEPLVRVLAKSGQDAFAQSAVHRVAEQAGNTPDGQRAVARLNGILVAAQSDRLRQQGQFAQAFDLLQAQWNAAPGNPELLSALARLYQSGGLYPQASQTFQMVLNQAPQDKGALIGLIDSASAAGDFDNARQATARAIALSPGDYNVYMAAARMEQARGDERAAMRYLKRARELYVGASGRAAGGFTSANPFANRPQGAVANPFMAAQQTVNPFALGNPQAAAQQPMPAQQMSAYPAAPQPINPAPMPGYAQAAPAYAAPMAPVPQMAQAPITDPVLQSIDRDMRALGTETGPRVDVSTGYRQRSGEVGLSQLKELGGTAEISTDFAGGRVSGKASAVVLDAGRPSGSGLARFGRNATAEAIGIVEQQPSQLTQADTQHASGVAVSVGYENKIVKADIGTTPLGFEKNQVAGGITVTPRLSRYATARIWAERRPVTDSVISYAGTTDPVSGAFWGAVMKAGGGVSFSYDRDGSGVYADGSYYRYDGTNVADNHGIQVNVGGYLRIYRATRSSLTVGVNANYQQFGNNQNYFTFGHGGYFSPQSFLSVSFPLRYAMRGERLDVDASIVPGYQSYDQGSSLLYPTDPAAQGQLDSLKAQNDDVRSRFDSISKTGFGISAGGSVYYRVSPGTRIGGELNLNTFGDYNEFKSLIGIRQQLGGGNE